jgi:hypothetical protein
MSEPAAVRTNSGAVWIWVLAGLLLALHFGLAVGGKRTASTTTDELVHLTAGVSYWKNHDYRLHPENGNFPQRWAALPAVVFGATFPPLEGNDYWRTSDAWNVGHQFFYETGEDHFPRLMAGRAMIALFSVGTGVLVFLWSRRFFGPAGALVSLTFFAFSPDFLAHGALVTSDVCMVFFFLAAIGCWWWHLHDHRWRVWWLSAVTLGLAFVAKYSAVLLVPMMILMAAARAWSAEPWTFGRWQWRTRAGKFGFAALSALGHGAVVLAVIWTCYGFRYAAFNPALPPATDFIRPWADYVGQTGLIGEATRALATLRALPEGFLYGFDYVLATTKTRAAFLNGEYSPTGWRSFFAWTFLLKTTFPVLLGTILVIGYAARGALRARFGPEIGRRLYPWTPLLALLLVYGASSITSQLNIGHRHILPLYPPLFIALGLLGSVGVARSLRQVVPLVVLLGWQAWDAVRIAPHHLAYFNAIAGGPANGWRHLVDSSLDWGQDLPALQRWLKANAGSAPVYLSYFGTGQPEYYGLSARRLTFVNNFGFEHPYVGLEPGVYAISATILQQVYSPVQPPWTPEREREYQELRQLEPLFAAYTREPERRAELLRNAPAERWRNGIRRHETLRMARLTSYLRVRGPDADAGHSILIFRLTAEEIRAATAGSWSEWSRLLEQAAAPSP